MRICMVAYTFYESDSRVIRYAEALAKRGDQVDVIALRREGQSSQETINDVSLFRIQGRTLDGNGLFSYLARLLLFLSRSMAILAKEHLKARYNLIHVHSIPDFLVFAALFPRLQGSKIILDIHDLLPELYASRFKRSHNTLIFKLLLEIERVSTMFSDHVIVANHIWGDRLRSRCVPDGKCTVILNFPDQSLFPREKSRPDNKFVILYPGTLNWHQGVDIAIRAFARIRDQAPNAVFHIYGEGPARRSLIRLVGDLGLHDRVFIRGIRPLHEIATVMRNSDLGIVPKRADCFGNEAFSTKILEFMSAGVPVVVSDTKVDRYYFNESVVKYFRHENEDDLANCMLQLIRNQELRSRLTRNATEFVKRYDWNLNKNKYLELVDSLAQQETILGGAR